MGISQTTSAIMVFLAGLLPASCHRESAKTSPAATTSAVAANGTTNSASTDSLERAIGKVALTNLNDTYVQFSTGESFTLTPKIIDKENVRITLAVESKDVYGETHNFAVTQVSAQSGKPMNVSIGGYHLSFTPQVYPQN